MPAPSLVGVRVACAKENYLFSSVRSSTLALAPLAPLSHLSGFHEIRNRLFVISAILAVVFQDKILGTISR